MKSIRLVTQALFSVLVLTLASGCSITHAPISMQQSPLPAGRVLPHHAVLVLNQELADYKVELHLVGGSDVYPIGSALQDYARNVTGKCFQQIDVVPSEEKASSFASDDLILIPQVVKSDTSFGNGQYNATLVVVWTVKNRTSLNVVWLKTITANASEEMGSPFNNFKHRRHVFQRVIDDLSSRTYEAFQGATALQGSQP
jgi:hypothetical protein